MTAATTLPFSGVKVLLESATVPGTFVAPCGLTERSLTLSKETNDTNIPDCTDEDAASWVGRDVVSKSASISGNGVMAKESHPRWRAAYEANTPVLCRVEVAGLAAAGGGYWSGNFHLTSFVIGAERGQRVTAEIEMQSDGPVIWTAAAT